MARRKPVKEGLGLDTRPGNLVEIFLAGLPIPGLRMTREWNVIEPGSDSQSMARRKPVQEGLQDTRPNNLGVFLAGLPMLGLQMTRKWNAIEPSNLVHLAFLPFTVKLAVRRACLPGLDSTPANL